MEGYLTDRPLLPSKRASDFLLPPLRGLRRVPQYLEVVLGEPGQADVLRPDRQRRAGRLAPSQQEDDLLRIRDHSSPVEHLPRLDLCDRTEYGVGRIGKVRREEYLYLDALLLEGCQDPRYL